MSLSIGSALSGGIRRTVNRNGAKIAFGYVALGLLWQVMFYSAISTWLERTNAPMAAGGLPSIEAPLAVSVGAAIVSLVLLQYLTIVAIRTFVGGYSRSIPSEYFTRNIGFVIGNSILGGLAFGLIILVGSLLLLVPGIIGYVAFSFFVVYLAVEDENFVAALRDSWTLTRGHWLRLFVLLTILVVGIGVVSGIVSGLATFVVGAATGQALGTLVSGVIGLPFSLITLGVLAEAFNQLQDRETGTESPTTVA